MLGFRKLGSGKLGSGRVVTGGGGPTTTPVNASFTALGINTLSNGLEISNISSYNATGTLTTNQSIELSRVSSYIASGLSSLAKTIQKTIGYTGTGTTIIPKSIQKVIQYSATGNVVVTQALLIQILRTYSAAGSVNATAVFSESSGITLIGIDELPSYNAVLNNVGDLDNLPMYLANKAIIYSHDGTYYGTTFLEL